MMKAAKTYVRYMDAISRVVGRIVMYLVFGMIGILLYEALSRTIFHHPNVWSVETAQFVMAAYYTLGGAFALLYGGHVRMDLFYSGWSPRKKAIADVITFFTVLVYFGTLIYGGIQGIQYAVEFHQTTYTAWGPSVLPVKVIMVAGMILIFLQFIAEFIKDIALIKGEKIL